MHFQEAYAYTEVKKGNLLVFTCILKILNVSPWNIIVPNNIKHIYFNLTPIKARNPSIENYEKLVT